MKCHLIRCRDNIAHARWGGGRTLDIRTFAEGTEKHQLPAPVLDVADGSTCVLLSAHKPLAEMNRAERGQACFWHASLVNSRRESMTKPACAAVSGWATMKSRKLPSSSARPSRTGSSSRKTPTRGVVTPSTFPTGHDPIVALFQNRPVHGLPRRVGKSAKH